MHEGGDDRWSKIPVGTDTSASANRAVQAAAESARASDAELLVLHECDPNSSHTPRTPEGSFVHFTEVMVNRPEVSRRPW
jgi:nucleotide-binding universal stress UspA family protein